MCLCFWTILFNIPCEPAVAATEWTLDRRATMQNILIFIFVHITNANIGLCELWRSQQHCGNNIHLCTADKIVGYIREMIQGNTTFSK